MNKYIVCLLFFIGVSSCNKETKYSIIPKITFKGFDVNSIKAGGAQNVTIALEFEDGDGDVGFGSQNLFLRDTRGSTIIPFLIPTIDKDYNPEKGVKGIMQIEYPGSFLLTRTDTAHLERDTLTWKIIMKDKKGNWSDTVETSPLILLN